MNTEVLTGSAAEIGPGAATHVAALPSEPGRELWFRRRMSLRSQLAEIWQFRELVVTLAERDLRARYKQAVLGFAWAMLTPLLLMLAFTFLFTRFAKVNSHGIPYPLFSYIALIPWTFFNGAVSGGGTSLVSNMSVLNKVYCPRELFVLGSVLVAAVDALFSTFVLLILFLAFGTTPHIESVYLVLLLPVLLVFTFSIALLVAAILVYFRDLSHALPLILQFALLATPVAYGLSAISHSRGLLLAYSAVNPLAPVIDGFRRTVLMGLPPDWEALGVATLSSLLLLAISYRVFKRLETGMADIA